MKEVLKRILIVLAAVVLFPVALIFAACGKDEPDDATKPVVTPEPEFLPGYDVGGATVAADGDKADLEFGGLDFAAMEYKEDDFTMKYRIYVPEVTEDAPVLMFFHGAGERGDDNAKQLTTYSGLDDGIAMSEEAADAIIIAPQCPGTPGDSNPTGMKWVDVSAWNECEYSVGEIAESEPMEAALKILKIYEDEYSFDRDSVYAAGLSMGGYATWDAMTRHPDVFAGGAPVCGGCDVSKAELLADKIIYTFHGSADGTVPPDGTRKMYEALESYGNISYTEYEGQGHGIWNTAFATEGLFDDLLSGTRPE